MNKVLPVGILIFILNGITQMGFLLNSGVVNGHYLTLLGVSVGLVIGTIYFVVRKRVSDSHSQILYDTDKRPWHQQPPNYFITYFTSVLICMFVATIANKELDRSQAAEMLFQVQQIGVRRVRYELYDYVRLSSPSTTLLYLPDDGQNFAIGRSVIVTMQEGFFGFPHIIDVVPESS